MHIYKWTHIESGKVYIGQSIQDPNRRRLEHIADCRYSSKKHHFHNAIRKYGKESFAWEVIDYAKSLEELNELEEKYIDDYDSIKTGYNLRQGGNNRKHSEQSIKLMKESQKAAHTRRRESGGDGGWTRKDGGAMKGKTQTASAKSKIGTANSKHYKGKTWEEIYGVEEAKKRRDAMKQRAKQRKEQKNV
jgi:group I intron endonuclease